MTEYAIRTFGLSKQYGKAKVLDGVNINIPRGVVYGLVGRNGAGKTTLLKILTGSIAPDEGYIAINDATSFEQLNRERKDFGAIVESPMLYSFLSAKQNMYARAMLLNIANPTSKIEELLELFDLSNTGTQKVGTFSLGMKQRLGLAQTLLSSPKILILDEPTNGLDPIGIQLMRKVLTELSIKGVTIIISSHLISELSQLATMFCILHKGKVVKEMTSEDILMMSNGVFDIGFANLLYLNKAMGVLANAFGAENIQIHSDNILKVKVSDEKIGAEQIVKILLENEIQFTSVGPTKTALEYYFVDLMQGGKQ